MIIEVDDEGNIFARKEYLPLINKMNKRRRKINQFGHYADTSSSDSSEDGAVVPLYVDEVENPINSPKNSRDLFGQDFNHTP